jgi:hypothetical protein
MWRGLRVMLAIALAGGIGLVSGCGGGDGGSGSTTRTFAGHTVTVPEIKTRSTTTGSTTTGTVPSTITLPSGVAVRTSQLTPFRDCLRRHNVQPPPLDSSSSTFTTPTTPQEREQLAAEVRAWVACAPSLPSPLRERLERFGRQLRQRH